MSSSNQSHSRRKESIRNFKRDISQMWIILMRKNRYSIFLWEWDFYGIDLSILNMSMHCHENENEEGDHFYFIAVKVRNPIRKLYFYKFVITLIELSHFIFLLWSAKFRSLKKQRKEIFGLILRSRLLFP